MAEENDCQPVVLKRRLYADAARSHWRTHLASRYSNGGASKPLFLLPSKGASFFGHLASHIRSRAHGAVDLLIFTGAPSQIGRPLPAYGHRLSQCHPLNRLDTVKVN